MPRGTLTSIDEVKVGLENDLGALSQIEREIVRMEDSMEELEARRAIIYQRAARRRAELPETEETAHLKLPTAPADRAGAQVAG